MIYRKPTVINIKAEEDMQDIQPPARQSSQMTPSQPVRTRLQDLRFAFIHLGTLRVTPLTAPNSSTHCSAISETRFPMICEFLLHGYKLTKKCYFRYNHYYLSSSLSNPSTHSRSTISPSLGAKPFPLGILFLNSPSYAIVPLLFMIFPFPYLTPFRYSPVYLNPCLNKN